MALALGMAGVAAGVGVDGVTGTMAAAAGANVGSPVDAVLAARAALKVDAVLPEVRRAASMAEQSTAVAASTEVLLTAVAGSTVAAVDMAVADTGNRGAIRGS